MIIVDTGALYALADRNDRHHESAVEFYKAVAGQEDLAIPTPVLTESWLLINAKLGDWVANKLVDSIVSGAFIILETTFADLKAAVEIDRRYPKARFGLIDATCFAICERRAISRIFTYDRKHFSIYKPNFADYFELLPG